MKPATEPNQGQTKPAAKAPQAPARPRIEAESITNPLPAKNEAIQVAPAKKEKDFSSLINKLKEDASKEIE